MSYESFEDSWRLSELVVESLGTGVLHINLGPPGISPEP